MYLLLTNSVVNAVVGLALMMAWRRHREQAFLRALGASTVLQAVVPPAYLWWKASQGLSAAFAVGILSVTGTGILMLLMIGAASLAGRPLSRRQQASAALALGLAYLVLIPYETRLAHAFTSVMFLVVGLLAARWLWPQKAAEQLSGLVLVLIGVNQFWYVFLGESGLDVQVSIGIVLRTSLGLLLMYAALRRSGEATHSLRDQYLRMTEKSHFGVIVIQGERVPYANPAAYRIYDRPLGRTFPVPWRSPLLAESDQRRALERHHEIIAGKADHVMWEGPRRRHDGRLMFLRFAAWRIEWDGRPAEQIVVIDDTEHRDATSALLHQATHDSLTGLPNRSALLGRLQVLCGVGQAFALLLMDVDRFKLFNEAHGPAVGDSVLKALAQALSALVPSAAAELMHLGEDEFAMLLPLETSDAAAAESAALALAGAVRERLREPLDLPAQRFYVDMSIGIALHPESGHEPDGLLRLAQAAMNQAKREPGLSVRIGRVGIEQGSGKSLQAEQALRAGLRNEEFVLVYQPKVSAADGRLTGFEALVRWQRPGMGLVSPADFIPAAERTGLIGELGALILDKACAQIAAWRSEGLPMVPVAVNVSPIQLLDQDFAAVVSRALARHEVPPDCVSIEITETAAVTHLDEARQRIAELTRLGLAVALDDFGAGVSSLNILRSLPLQTVKIDRLLVDPMPAPDATAVVRAVCQLARALNLLVVAEGVETIEQAEAAARAGCDDLQGFHISRPLAPAEARGWLLRQSSLVD